MRRTDCDNEPTAMSETYPLRAKAIGRSWALELALGIRNLGITGIGPIGVMPDPVLRRTERGVPPREALSGAA
jgi:hypothetical protein